MQDVKVILPSGGPVRRYVKEFSAAMVLYIIVLVLSIILLKQFDDASLWLRTPITLAPVVPCCLMCWIIVRDMRRIDEMQLRIQFEALGFAFAATALITFSYGFLENVGMPHLSWLMVWPIMAAMWMIGLGMARRRYQ